MNITAEFIKNLQSSITSTKLTELDNVLCHILWDVMRERWEKKHIRLYHPKMQQATLDELKQLGFTIGSKPESKQSDAWFYYIVSWENTAR